MIKRTMRQKLVKFSFIYLAAVAAPFILSTIIQLSFHKDVLNGNTVGIAAAIAVIFGFYIAALYSEFFERFPARNGEFSKSELQQIRDAATAYSAWKKQMKLAVKKNDMSFITAVREYASDARNLTPRVRARLQDWEDKNYQLNREVFGEGMMKKVTSRNFELYAKQERKALQRKKDAEIRNSDAFKKLEGRVAELEAAR